MRGTSLNSIPSPFLNHTFRQHDSRFTFGFISTSSTLINNRRPSLPRLRAQQSETTDEYKVRNSQDEVSATQGIRIRRRSPTGPKLHYVGPFEFRLQNEGKHPGGNCLEQGHRGCSGLYLPLVFDTVAVFGTRTQRLLSSGSSGSN
ncbi:hypothetical protein L1987_33647 [Smallanthus sonchifolius]|uniref:Uncharacterized protein n=1 Tax=Smallanthus sonchifolius TaxID=185202 RepID=A0ACB9HSF2_9ASTR|nr:hypothetical protein L1987_33647 [Smallanthus sonchifolius]